MDQSRWGSLVETVVNVAIGFVVSMVLTALVFPAYGHHVTFNENLHITTIFTVASILRGYMVRRWFSQRIHKFAQAVTHVR